MLPETCLQDLIDLVQTTVERLLVNPSEPCDLGHREPHPVLDQELVLLRKCIETAP
jgi:hypothetical protein